MLLCLCWNIYCALLLIQIEIIYKILIITSSQGLRFPLARSPEASQTQLGRVKAICDLARLASGIIVVISVFNSLLTCFRLCTTWHEHTMFTYVYGTTRIRCLTHKLQHGTHTHQCIVFDPEL